MSRVRAILTVVVLLAPVAGCNVDNPIGNFFGGLFAPSIDGAWELELDRIGRVDCLVISGGLVTADLADCVEPAQILQAFEITRDGAEVTIPWSKRQLTTVIVPGGTQITPPMIETITSELMVTLRGEFLTDSLINGDATLFGTIDGTPTTETVPFTLTRR